MRKYLITLYLDYRWSWLSRYAFVFYRLNYEKRNNIFVYVVFFFRIKFCKNTNRRRNAQLYTTQSLMTGHWWLKNCDYSFNSVSVAFVGQFAILLSCKSLLNSKIGSKITIISKSLITVAYYWFKSENRRSLFVNRCLYLILSACTYLFSIPNLNYLSYLSPITNPHPYNLLFK